MKSLWSLLWIFSAGRITGLLDDRGKFIYISVEEMQAVAKWIRLQVCVCVCVCVCREFARVRFLCVLQCIASQTQAGNAYMCITGQGRVSIADLATESNKLVDLQPKDVPSRTSDQLDGLDEAPAS